VFLTAWRKIDQIPDEPADLYWLYGVARRVLANHNHKIWRRSRISHRLRNPTFDEALPEDVVVRRESDETVLIALGRLRVQDRELIMLAYWDELPHTEIADLLGVSRGTVDVRLHRAVGRLGKELARSGHVQAEGFLPRTPKEFEC
jgi:RNA polymerase sigma-70 factor (ECF subfamily)